MLRAAVVQSVRIPACHAGGRGFESRPLRHYSASRPLNSLKQQKARLVRVFCCLRFLWSGYILHHATRGSELIREGFIPPTKNLSDVPAPSQASSLPRMLGFFRRTLVCRSCRRLRTAVCQANRLSSPRNLGQLKVHPHQSATGRLAFDLLLILIPPNQCRITGMPSLSEGPSGGARALWLLSRSSKVTRRKGATNSSRYRSNGYTHTHTRTHAHRLAVSLHLPRIPTVPLIPPIAVAKTPSACMPE